ncbi:MAG: hypothetical protein MJ099_05850 [Clostridia bacterium]|nr:hypothetical protein [Clostridia bacterium]
MKRMLEKWPVIWLLQWLTMLIVGLLVALAIYLGAVIHTIVSWAALPILGAVSAYRVTRKGVSNYLAFWAPPITAACAHWLFWGYPPSAGVILVCGFVSLVGAAAGEVVNRDQKTTSEKER